MTSPQYRLSIFCFLDILGYKDWLNELGDEAPEIIQQVLSGVLHSQRERFRDADIEIKILSDSILIWTENVSSYGFWRLANLVQLTVYAFLKHGLLCRGAITVGNSYLNADIIVSPALAEAYVRENAAIYPRIIVTEKASSVASADLDSNTIVGKTRAVEPSDPGRWVYVDRSLILNDHDGEEILEPFFFDFETIDRIATSQGVVISQRTIADGIFVTERSIDMTPHIKSALREVNSMLTTLGQKNAARPQVLRKVNYLVSKYNAFLGTLDFRGKPEPIAKFLLLDFNI